MAMGAYGCMDLGGWDNMDIGLCVDVYNVGMAWVQATVASNLILMRRWWKYT